MNGQCSCLCEQLLSRNDWKEQTVGGRKEQCGMNHMQPMRYFAISQLWKMHAGLRVTFIWKSHLLQGAFPRELVKMHFLCCLGKTERVWSITAESKLKQTTFLTLLMWDIWVYKWQFTNVEEPGGLRDLMEQSVWISCRMILGTVFWGGFFARSLPQPEALWLTAPHL